jgi:AbrB family looped-hinge helix DNA binding protein
MVVKVSPKYQVVIPEAARKALNLKPGTQVDVIVKGGIAYLVPVKSFADIRKNIDAKLTHRDRTTLREKRDRKI